MKKRALAIILAALLLVTPALAYGGGTGDAVYVNRTALANGLTYENALSYTSAGRRVETFALEIDPSSEVYPIVLACDTIYGGYTISNMISYAESQGYNVVGAINADFGYWDTRIPCGMVVEDGVYKSSPEGNNAIGFTDGKAVSSYMPEVNITLENLTRGTQTATTHLNKSRAESGLYLYSEYFSTVSTRTSTDGWFVRFKVSEGSLGLDGQMQLEVLEVIEDQKSVQIGEGNLVLTAADAANLGVELDKFEVGDRVRLTTTCSDTALAKSDWVSGCGNVLVQDGKIFNQQWWDSSISEVNPRTVIGIKADGTVIYEVMDGRTTASRGATLEELANDMISRGCMTVVNMDGGGSSILNLRMPGKSGYTTVNSPSDGKPRSVCSYILFVTDKVSSSNAERLFLSEDGVYVLAGSSIDLTAAATDATLKPVNLTSSVSYSAERGSVTGNVYTAPNTSGMDTIKLSALGLSGTGTLHIVDTIDALTVKDKDDKTVNTVILDQGETLSLVVSASRYLRNVYMDSTAVSYKLEGDVGSISADGVFTAAGKPSAEGKIIVSAAGASKEITVKLSFEFTDMKGHWAEDYVKDLYEAGIVQGATANTFAPNNSMKRCDFLVMLYRAVGSPEPGADSGFADVPVDAYYAKAVAWAVEQGVTQGKSEDSFAPSDTLTRQEGFTFLYRALTALGVSYTDGDIELLTQFEDSADLSGWAETPSATLVGMGIIEGGNSGLNPGGTLTRAQMAKMLAVTLYRD